MIYSLSTPHTHTHTTHFMLKQQQQQKNPNTNFPCLLWKSLDTSEYSELNCTTMYSTDRCTQLSYDQFVQSVREPSLVTTLNQLCFFFDLKFVPWIIAGLNFLFYINIMDITIHHNVFSSVAQSCPTFCDPMNRSMPGLPVHHLLPEFTQTHVH